jgi:hypothetical protein
MLFPKIEEKKLIGLKIITVGFISVILGLLVFVLLGQSFGKIIIYLGFIVGIVGMITHFFILFRKSARSKN